MSLRQMPRRGQPRSHRKTLAALAVQRCFEGCAVAIAAGLLASGPVAAQVARNWSGKLPLPSGPAGQPLAVGSTTLRQPQVVYGSFDPYQVSGATATVTQKDATGILRWSSFDIAPGYRVVIDQPSTTAVLLNKVDGGAFDNKTVIDGMLQGKGQVYIYNPNGIIFGKNSVVNVNSLVATSLKIDDNRLLAGLIAPSADPIFSTGGTPPGSIVVEGAAGAGGVVEQAQINADRGGRIMLLGSSVSNSGRLSAPDGQVIAAAASDRVYLAAPTDVRMRGLLVEVGTGGTVSNEQIGQILVERGNASLVGLAVNQNGTVSATTSVQANGSIYLRARDGARKPDSNPETSAAFPTHGGTLTLGTGSVTEVLPDLADTTTAAKTSYNPSQIELSGQSVHLLAGARVVAPGGDVVVAAQADPLHRSTTGITGGTVGGNGVYLESGATIDVAGTTSTELPMESNVIEVQLRGTELADVPLLRNSVLRGKTVYIDRRKGTPLANVQGWLDLVEYGIGENTAAGGTVTFSADQEVTLAEGSRVAVSGGAVTYKSGYVATTQLRSGAYSVDIGSATPDRVYTGVVNAQPGPRNFEAGYRDGRSAGSVRFDAPALILRGSLEGAATPGVKQRDVTSGNYPKGGELVIGSSSRVDSTLLGAWSNFSFVGTVNFGGTATAGLATPAFGAAWDPASTRMQNFRSGLDLDPAALAAAGFSRINAYSREDVRPMGDAWGSLPGSVAVSSALNLGPGGELRLAAKDTATLGADVTIPGGTVEVKAATGRLTVGSGVTVDVAGRWTNDRSTPAPARDAQGNPTAPLTTAGGSILLSGKGSLVDGVAIDIGDGAGFDVSGGAWQNAAGKIAGGAAGTVSITAGAQDDLLPETAGFRLGDSVTFKGYGLSKGGTLKLSGRNVVLGAGGGGDPLDLALGSFWFTQGGFAKYDITAAGNLTVLANATISPTMDYWIADRGTAAAAGGRMEGAFSVCALPGCLPSGSRAPATLSLTAGAQRVSASGRLWVQQGASIATDPGGAVSLTAGRQLTMDGRIAAPGGAVSLLLSADPTNSDIAYRAERAIWLGNTAVVDASGTAAGLWTDNKGLTQGSVLDGGSIRIGRLSGGVLVPAAAFVFVSPGARLDVSGRQAEIAFASGRVGVVKSTVASAGGSIDIRSREGIFFEGSLSAAGGNASARGGSLSLVLDREGTAGPGGAPAGARELTILGGKLAAGTPGEYIVPRGLHADEAVDDALNGKAYVLASTLNNSGFDSVRLKSQDRVTFDGSTGDVAVSVRSAASVDAPVIAESGGGADTRISLGAAYVSLGNSDWRTQGAVPAPAAGDGATLEVRAATVDLVGRSSLQGFATSNFTADQDIRLVGVVAKDLSLTPLTQTVLHAVGELQGVGTMAFTSGQLYPTTMSEFSLTGVGAASKIVFAGNGSTFAAPLSAAGTLAVSAGEIVQGGVVRAPFGQISFSAQDRLSFTAGSLTSVAGSGTVPLGRVNNGRDWLYDFGNGNVVTLGNPSASNGVALPEKRIGTSAPHVEVATGATMDLAGGGDLYAYEFTAGPGGSRDVLAKVAGASSANVFAIVPGYDRAVAPVDFQYQQDGGLTIGDRIYLSGMPGLAAGYYTLLPAHYALLPGGYAVTAAAGTRDMAAVSNYARVDGTWLVAGYRGSAVAKDGRWSGFLVTSSDQVRNQSAFTNYSATGFGFTGGAQPMNGGHLVFSATGSLTLEGLFKLGGLFKDGAAVGAGGIADISAPDLRVVANASDDAGGAVKLVAGDLAAMGADSLLLGAVRDVRADGTHLTVNAGTVTVANDATHPLVGSEIILAARDQVLVKGGSAVASRTSSGGATGNLMVEGTGAGADGALLRVSAGKRVAVVRNAPAGARGTLTIENGAQLAASGSMNLDATKLLDNRGSMALARTADLNLGANRISFGDAIPGANTGLRFDSAALADLNLLTDLSLTSYSTFDFYGPVNLGKTTSSSLSLRGGDLRFHGSSGDTVALTAETIRFDGFGPVATPLPGASGATLAVVAKDVVIGDGGVAVSGFGNVQVTAQREVRASGKGGALVASDAMTVAAGRISADSGADGAVQAGGTLTLTGVASPETPTGSSGLGGVLNFFARLVQSDANVVAKSGQIAMTSTSTGGVRITGGTIDAGGSEKTFGGTKAYSPGGTVTLDGGSGDVVVDAGATIDVSSVGADAGKLAVKATNGANGKATLNGNLKGSAAAVGSEPAPAQGRFSLDVDQEASFGQVNARLNSGGFTAARDFRVRHGNVALGAGESIVARDVLIAADNGNVSVGGTINADGAKGGSIQIYAGQATAGGGAGNLTIIGGASLSARATTAATSAAGSPGDGGRVVLGTSTQDGSPVASTVGDSSILVQAGALIDVSGSGAGQGGTVTFRAPRVGGGAGVDVAVGQLAGTIAGSRETVIEAVKAYTGQQITAAADSATNLDATTSGRMYADSATFSGSVAAILSRLGLGGNVKVRPGVEVRSTGDLLVSVDENASSARDRGWDLNPWRFGGEPGVLALRAGGNLTIQGSLSDGFVKSAGNVGMPGWDLDTSGTSSWSYRLSGGADMTGANPLAVQRSDTAGDVTIAFARSATDKDQPVALVRTGTGRIDVAAGRDVVLGSTAVTIPDPYDASGSVATTLGATIYTAGRYAPLEIGFLAPKNQTVNALYTNGSKVTTSARFAEGGGDIGIAAGRDVVGAVTPQLATGWLFRRGKTTLDASGNTIFAGPVITDGNTPATRYEAVLSTGWWSRYDFFNQGVATLGGGDVNVVSGRDVVNLSVSAATSGQVPADADKKPTALAERGGGDIALRAARDIRGGNFYVQKGTATLAAGGGVVAGDQTVADQDLGAVTLRPTLALGDARVTVTALGNVEVETAFNPTLVQQSPYNADADVALKRQSPLSVFSTYSADSGLSLTSLSGDVVLGNRVLAVNTASAPWRTGFDLTYLVYPASVKAAAMSGDLVFDNGFSLWPSPVGQLSLLAQGSVRAAYPRRLDGLNIAGARPIVMIDAAPGSLPGVLAPKSSVEDYAGILNPTAGTAGLVQHTAGGLHAGDGQPVRVVALSGDIVGENYYGGSNLNDTLISPKAVEIIAGRDIRDFGFSIQQLGSGDASLVKAGRDVVDSTLPDLNPVRHVVAGPGRFDMTAGRDIDLGTSSGIVTRGNLDNPYLPEAGASINLIAGAKPDYAGFAAKYLDPAEMAYYAQNDVVAMNDIFFRKLRETTGSLGGELDLAKFDAIIDSLFPLAQISGGNINVFGSQLKTARGGSVNLFAPGGSIQAGLAEKPAWVKSRLLNDKTFEANLGIYTIAGGNLQALVKQDFLVNQGRVFTLGGGDITLVSQYGNIDAGKGAKTAQSTPPPVIRTDEKGNTIVDISGSISGSGIATLRSSPDVPASSVYPIAPRGVFDAGDAGVRSTGSVNIVAQTVLNANNIAAAGSVSGAKTTDASGLAGAVAVPATAPVAKTESFTNAANPDANAATSLTVELVGYGDAAAAGRGQQPVTQDSQTAGSDDAEDDRKKKKKSN